jgi:hypothetical protein
MYQWTYWQMHDVCQHHHQKSHNHSWGCRQYNSSSKHAFRITLLLPKTEAQLSPKTCFFNRWWKCWIYLAKQFFVPNDIHRIFHLQGHGMNHHMLSDRLGASEYDNGSRIVTLTNNMNTKLWFKFQIFKLALNPIIRQKSLKWYLDIFQLIFSLIIYWYYRP